MGLIYRDYSIDIDLVQSDVHVNYANMKICEGDNKANRFAAVVKRNGEPVDLAGASCVGYFIRPDGITLVIAGGIDGNNAYVILPEAAYARAGAYSLSIKLSSPEFSDTLCVINGSVYETTTGDISDASSSIPSLSAYEEKTARAEAAAVSVGKLHVTDEQITGTRYEIAITIDS